MARQIRRAVLPTLLATMFVPGPAFAAGPDPVETPETATPPESSTPPETPTPRALDEVQLVSGDLVRGTIVEVVDGSHVTIAIAGTGEELRVAWADVARTTRATKPTDPAPAPPPAPVAPTPIEDAPVLPTTPGKPHLRVVVDGDDPVKLYRIAIEARIATSDAGAHATGYVIECPAPCNRVVDGAKGEEFFVGGARITDSTRFDLVDRTGHWQLNVRPGKKAVYGTGLALTCFGGGFSVGGAALLGMSSSLSSRDGLRNASIGMLVSGLVALAVGIPLIVDGRTRVKWTR